MSIFKRFFSEKKDSEQGDMIREIKQIYQEEHLPIDEAKLRRTCSETKIELLKCHNKCPMIINVGVSTPRDCPYCGQTLQLLKKLQKEIEQTQAELARLTTRLNDNAFLSKAPAAVVDKERDRLKDRQDRLARLKQQLSELKP